MATKSKGKQTIKIESPVSISSSASIVGAKEGQGPLRTFFDIIIDDEMWGEKSWEKAENRIIRETYLKILKKADKQPHEINYIFSGDLLNQCTAANYGLRDSETSYFGLYGACSTIAESLILGTMAIDGGFADNVICITSSHFCSAEKQFRFPLELGTQRAPSAQWTVTGSGGVMPLKLSMRDRPS
jgi:stage V sporulation protein AD